MRTGLRGIAIALLLTGCVEYDCGDDLVYSPSQHRCVCPEDFAELDGGVCVAVDAGPLDCPGGASAMTVYDDADDDGYGRPDTEHLACPGTPGTAPNADDCDDACAACYPGATEVCDGRDNDCTSGADDTFACVQGTATECETSCGSTGVATCATDCTLPATCTPPAETCNRVDDDCDGLADEGVLEFGDAIDWLQLAGDNLRIEARPDGLIATWNDEVGVHAHLIDTLGNPTGATVVLAGASNVRHLDADVSGDRLYVTYSVETTYPAHEIFLLTAEMPSLTVTAGPRRIASLESSPRTLHVENSYATMVFYEPPTGVGVRMRSGFDITADAFAERTVVNVRTSGFDVVAPSITSTKAYVVYAGQLTEAEDREIFVQPVTPSGGDGAAHRLTDNTYDDDRPVAVDADDRLAIVWNQRADETAFTGMLRVHSLVPSSGEEWPSGSEITAMPLGWLSTYSIVPSGRQWLVFATAPASESASKLFVRPITWDASSAGSPLELEFPGLVTWIINSPRLIESTPWLAIGRGADGHAAELDARPLVCR